MECEDTRREKGTATEVPRARARAKPLNSPALRASCISLEGVYGSTQAKRKPFRQPPSHRHPLKPSDQLPQESCN